MNSRERFLAALAGQPTDRAPVAHVAALTTLELQSSTGCTMPDVHFDPDAQARLSAANHDVLGFDAVSFIINYFGEPAALGAQMDWGAVDRLPSFQSNPWQVAEDAAHPDDLLDRPPISTYLKMLRIAKRRYGDRMAVLGKVMGPFSMTLALHGIEKVLIGLIENPTLIEHFLAVSVDILVRCANAQYECGIDALSIGEGGAGAQMLSPATYAQVLLPWHQKMVAAIDGPTILHICGDVTPRLAMMKRIGMTCFNFDWAIAPQRMVTAAADEFRLMGNVNTTDLLSAAPAKIAQQVVDNINAGVEIISPGCAVSPKCPNANLRTLADAVANHARGSCPGLGNTEHRTGRA